MEWLFESIKLITNCNCYLLTDNIPVEVSIADDSIGIAFAESLNSSISEYLLKIRISDDLPEKIRKLPVLFCGYKSFRSLIKSEKYPRLLASQGVDYFKLPGDFVELKSLIETISKSPIDDPIQVISKLLPSLEDQSQEEAIIIHTLGNFFGSEKLIFGAQIAKKLNKIQADSVLGKVVAIQKTYCRKEKINYDLYRIKQQAFSVNLTDSTGSNQNNDKVRRILFIDDLAHLGWSRAIAASLWGEDIDPSNDDDKTMTDIKVERFKNESSELISLSRPDETSEEAFLNGLLKSLTNFIDLRRIDIVLLDLRLMRKEDEKIVDPERSSGVRVLNAIRKINGTLPVIFLTASRRAKNMDKVYQLGADGYFIKEMFNKSDAVSDVAKYYEDFTDLISFAMSKSYLGAAWEIIKRIDSNKYGYELEHIKKALALLRRRMTFYEINSLKFNVYGEAVINMRIAFEYLTKGSRADLNSSFDRGNIIKSLRNVTAHGSGEYIDETDAQIVLYAVLRLFCKENRLFDNYYLKLEGFDQMSTEDIAQTSEKAINLLMTLKGMNKSKAALRDNDFFTYVESYKGKKAEEAEERKPTLAENILKNEKIYSRKQIRYLFTLCQLSFFPPAHGWINTDHKMYAHFMSNRLRKSANTPLLKENLQSLKDKFNQR